MVSYLEKNIIERGYSPEQFLRTGWKWERAREEIILQLPVGQIESVGLSEEFTQGLCYTIVLLKYLKDCY